MPLALALMLLPAVQETSDLRALIERYEADRSALRRFHAAPMSPARRERMKSFNEDRLKDLDSIDFAALGPDARIDHILFRNHLRHGLGALALEETRDAEVRPLAPFASIVVELEEGRRRLDFIDPAKAAGRLTELTRRVQESRKSAESEKPGKVVARRAAQRVESLRHVLKGWHDFFAGYHPEFTWWARKPHESADREMKEYAAFLRDRIAGGEEELVGDPIGREALLAELAFEMIPYSPEELIALAEKELAWCEARMAEAARDLGLEGGWPAALERVKTLHVPPGKQPELIRDLAREATRFVEERDLVTVPEICKETWRMEMMPPDRQKTTPYFTGGEVITVAFPTHDMTHEQKLMSLRGNNIHFARATVHHEIIPGHHLQGFMSERHRTHRQLFRTAFLVEGWGLYWELMLWDLGFPRSAEDRVGMLFWRSHRCARIIVSLKFHLGQMTPREMVDFLVKRIGHEPDGATAEVRRYIAGSYGPLYQCAYMLGALQLRALHKELVGSGKMTNRAYHDAVLRENAIPIELIRASLAGQKLAPDHAPGWRFLE